MRDYIALIHKDPDSDYGVSFPDLPGCITAGATLDEARDMAREALALHVGGLQEDGAPVPEPSSLEAVMADPVNRDGVAVLVPLAEPVKAVRVNITVPADALEEIDRYAEANGLTRSGLLVSAAKRTMMKLSDEERMLVHKALFEALHQVQERKSGAMHRVEHLFNQALAGDRRLLDAARSFAEDADGR